MKKIITVLSLLIATVSFAQTNLTGNAKAANGEIKIEKFSIEVIIDSLEEAESTFKTEDIMELLEMSDENEELSLKIVCNGETMSNGKKSNMSYTVKGNTNDKDGFIQNAEKIRNAAINYYKNK